jgi:hypothetical protein
MQWHLIFLLSALFMTQCDEALSQCLDKQRVTTHLPEIRAGIVEATSCGNSNGEGGKIRVDLLVDGEKQASATIAYVSSAYALSLDTTIKFNGQGLGVATGKGRDATGMHYWKITKNGKSMLDLGEAPSLTPDQFRKGFFSALVSSTGDYQSIRYYYTIESKKLRAKMAITFSPIDENFYIVSLMDISASGSMRPRKTIRISAKEADLCMTGKKQCM